MSSPEHARSKQPANPLAGPYAHQFYAIAITIPIGAWTASFVFDLIGLFSSEPYVYAQASRVLIIIGIAGALVAAVLGLMDLSRLAKGTRARKTAVVHALLNVGGLVLWGVNLAIRLEDTERIPVLGVVLSVVALAALGASGWLGGKLAYRYGVRVADEATQLEGFRR